MPRDPRAEPTRPPSAAALWAPLVPAIGWEQSLAARMARRPASAFLYEFLRFGVKQGWACLFGGIMVALMLGTHLLYPRAAPLARYDFLFLAALSAQALLLRFGLETWEEAKIIFLYHVIGTAMEIFKTSVGSWIYPEPAFFHIAGVPLFSGFMYASIGSYIARAWRLFDFRFTRHPPLWSLGALSTAIYANFFTHHYVADLRWVLFATTALLFGRSWVHYRIWQRDRSMPLLLGLFLVALFIWLAENIGTFSHVWLYPNQLGGWSMVSGAKLGAWFLLLIISYTLVAMVNKPEPLRA
ncbi:MAG TPA: DUF817 domain-containing protein [Aliidongia sp.]|nr:DUF817 domain-containing protein [Aliidongia sp.]